MAAPRTTHRSALAFCWGSFDRVGGPDRDRTDDLFHAIDPTLSFSTIYKTPGLPKFL
jgi:hypothetical protein